MSNINILIVEDHSLTRVGLKFTLEKYPELQVIGEAEDGLEGVNKTKELNPDIILMDLGMPNMNGVEATKEIKKFSPATKVLILTSHNDKEQVLAAFAAGADAYCMKDIPQERLITAIKSVFEGVVWIDPDVAKIVLTNLPAHGEKETEINVADANLTPREREVLELIVEGCSNADIAFKLCISQHTVKTHISNILSKLEVDDRTQAALKVIKRSPL